MQREFRNTKVRNNKREAMEYEIFKLKTKVIYMVRFLKAKSWQKPIVFFCPSVHPCFHVFELATKGVNIKTLKQSNYP
jgi:hypothetical protein